MDHAEGSEPTKRENRAGTPSTERAAEPLDADLARILDAWPKIPTAIKAGILAMIGTLDTR